MDRSRRSRVAGLGIVAAMLGAVVVMGGSPAAGAPAPSAAGDEDASPTTGAVVIHSADALERAEIASEIVADMSVRQRAAAVVMGHIPTTDPAVMRDYMATSGIGGFILMGANIPSTEQELRALTAALTVDPALPPLIAIDQEGGDVSRLPWDRFPSSLDLKGAAPETVAQAFAGRGALVDRAGIGVNFGIVADFTPDPGSFIYRRSLGTTAEDAAAGVGAATAGEQPFAASTLKHFPGHGAAPGDSHREIPSTGMPYEEWLAGEALPFAAGIDAGAPLLMYGHLSYSAIDATPASLSATWHRIAREDLGFEGVAITDDLGMLEASGLSAYEDPVRNAVAAIVAGNDMVLAVMFSDAGTATRMVDGIESAVATGDLASTRLEEAATRVVALRLEIAAQGRSLVPCAECAAVP